MTTVVDGVRIRRRPPGRGLLLVGPALVAGAAYVDPGNVATNTAAGAGYGYQLVWVVVVANAMAAMVQYLSAKLGIVTGESLPEALRRRLPAHARLAYWAQAEAVTMATDLAEIVGGAIALRILFDVPLVWGGVLTAAVSMVVLGVAGRGDPRRLHVAVVGMLVVVVVGFVAGLVLAPPDPGAVFGGLVPTVADQQSLLLVAAMLGATVMPHAVYAHSALARDQHAAHRGTDRREALSATRVDVALALGVAGAVNLALLLVGAAALAGDGRSDSIEGVHAALTEHVAGEVGVLFAVGLLFSGVASTVVGCYSGSVVMSGLLEVHVPVVARRLVTAIPAIVVLSLGVGPTAVLVVSQVVLSFGIPFAVVPLVLLTSRRAVMGAHVNRRGTICVAGSICAAIIAVNTTLLVAMATGGP